jgi:hypothetical protein
MSFKKVMIVLAVTLAIVLSVGAIPAMGEGHPAAKATAELSAINCIGQTTETNPGFHTILTNTIKTPNDKDLLIDVSLECGLYTDTHVKSKGGNKDESMAEATITVQVLVDGEQAYPGEVVFARRTQTLSAVFQGLLEGAMTVDDQGNVIIDEALLEPEEVELILDTMDAHSFNFVVDDLESGVHTVDVQAKIETDTDYDQGNADAWAMVGKGSMSVEEVRFIVDENILMSE